MAMNETTVVFDVVEDVVNDVVKDVVEDVVNDAVEVNGYESEEVEMNDVVEEDVFESEEVEMNDVVEENVFESEEVEMNDVEENNNVIDLVEVEVRRIVKKMQDNVADEEDLEKLYMLVEGRLKGIIYNYVRRLYSYYNVYVNGGKLADEVNAYLTCGWQGFLKGIRRFNLERNDASVFSYCYRYITAEVTKGWYADREINICEHARQWDIDEYEKLCEDVCGKNFVDEVMRKEFIKCINKVFMYDFTNKESNVKDVLMRRYGVGNYAKSQSIREISRETGIRIEFVECLLRIGLERMKEGLEERGFDKGDVELIANAA